MAGRQSLALIGLLAALWAAPPAVAAEPVTTGFGVVVTRDGYIFAPLRAVEDCETLRSPTLGPLRLLHHDPDLRLALLKADGGAPVAAPFGDSGTIEPGGPLLVVEPAARSPAGREFVATKATVKALIGSMSEALFITVIAADRPEKADALLFSHAGGLVGIMVADMGSRIMFGFDMRLWGGPPKGNAGSRDAIGEVVLRRFLEHADAAPEAVSYGTGITADEIAARAGDYTTPLECAR